MQDSHTPVAAAQTADGDRLRLVPTATLGLAERLAGRLDGHLARFVEHMREGLLAASTAVGLEVMAELMETEITDLAGPKGKHNPARVTKRHGGQDGTVTLGGRGLPVRRPRVRTVGNDEHELTLESYATFVSTDLLAEGVVARMLGGLSTRSYPVGLEPVGAQVEQTATGTSHSAVSRRFVTATAELLTVLLGGGYAAVVLGLGQLLGRRQSSLVVAGATLAVAGLFQPARRRVQQAVDRRFNRRRYDAARTIEGFSARLRQQVDLDTLTTELLAVVEQTMQPTSVSLWLRPSASASPDQRSTGASRAASQPTPASRSVHAAL
jgi:hypothetical protein